MRNRSGQQITAPGIELKRFRRTGIGTLTLPMRLIGYAEFTWSPQRSAFEYCDYRAVPSRAARVTAVLGFLQILRGLVGDRQREKRLA